MLPLPVCLVDDDDDEDDDDDDELDESSELLLSPSFAVGFSNRFNSTFFGL